MGAFLGWTFWGLFAVCCQILWWTDPDFADPTLGQTLFMWGLPILYVCAVWEALFGESESVAGGGYGWKVLAAIFVGVWLGLSKIILPGPDK